VRPLIKLGVAVVFVGFLAATYVYSYVPQLGAPTPAWATATHTRTGTPTVVVHTNTPTMIPPTLTRTRTATPTRVPPTATRTPAVTYVIVYGDSLWGIADKFNVSVEALMIANNLTDRDIIHEDQVLIIPRGTPTPPVLPTPTARPPAPVTRLPIPTSTPKP
jgi:LysM repeat protein